MKQRIIVITLIFLVTLTGINFLHKNLLMTTAQPLDSNNDKNIIRAGISTNDFSKFEYNEVAVSSSGKYEIIDKSTGSSIASSAGKGVFTVKVNNTAMSVYNSGRCTAQNITGPIIFRSLDNTPFEIVGLKRKGKPALYRGDLEIVQSPTKKGTFSVVNILPLEEYLKGVVPNELPVRFGLEALKAQTVAARNYAIKPRTKQYSQFDICDSVECQVYFGYNTEEPLSNRAIEETKGLVALYDDDLILALYSSTAGGYTENYENAFSEPGNTKFPASSLPYLKGKPDIAGTPALNTEEAARKFYTSSPPGFDVNSGYYRWAKSWSRSDLESVLNRNLIKYYHPAFIYPKLEKATDIGTLQKIEVLNRGVSGKAMVVKITTSKGEWHILKELIIRRVFEHSGRLLPSANVIFDNIYDSQGNLVQVEATGGGYGHGVGMSQYGAGFMNQKGYTFDQILQHYYDGVAIGTWPITLFAQNNPITARQTFVLLKGNATLIINNKDQLNNFKFIINSNEITISKDELNSEKVNINLDKYTNKGLNEIVYYSPEDKKGKSIKVWVEVFEPETDKSNKKFLFF
ncbi:MAG: SpoIID/LytB protein [uncultured bacterium]|nr:MAG: SpoIID/LytB protein [uncultured bacterium]